jgi:plasmid stability protein
MATLTIRDLDESLKRSLRIRAASRNRSMEEEARQILRAALSEGPGPSVDMASRIRARFAGLGDVVLKVPEREEVRTPPGFDETPGSEGVAVAPKRSRKGRRP